MAPSLHSLHHYPRYAYFAVTTATATATATATSTFAPSDLGSALQAWWKSDVGVTVSSGTVTGVADQTTKANDLTNTNSVVYTTSGFGTSNSPYFSFTATSSGYLKTGTTVSMGTAAASVFMVGTMSTATAAFGGAVSAKSSGTNDYDSNFNVSWIARGGASGLGNAINTNQSNSVSTSAITPDTNYRLGVTISSATQRQYVNNVAGDSNTVGNMLAGTSQFILGNRYVGGTIGGFAWDGKIAEIVVTNTLVSSDDRASLDAYFTAKWGI